MNCGLYIWEINSSINL